METSFAASYSIEMKRIELGPLSLRVFKLPQNIYCLCLVDVLGIESSDSSIRNTINSKIFKSPVMPESIHISGVEKVFTPVSFEAAILYWQRRAMEDSTEAQRVVRALTKLSLRERADNAFSEDNASKAGGSIPLSV